MYYRLVSLVSLVLALPSAAAVYAQEEAKKETTVITDRGEFPTTLKSKLEITGRTLTYDECNSIRNTRGIRHLRLSKVFLRYMQDQAVQRLLGLTDLEGLELLDSSQEFLRQLDETDRKELFPKLTVLRIRGNNLNFSGEQIPPDWIGWSFLRKLPSLAALEVNGAAFNGRCFKDQKLAVLKAVTLVDTNVVDSDLDLLARAAPKLTEITLERSRINGKGLKALGQLKHLKKLTVVSSALDEVNLERLKECAALEELVLHRKDTADTDAIGTTGIGHLAAIPKLKSLTVRLSPADVKELRKMAPSLTVQVVE